jgi:hypothetical protein
MNKRNLIKTLLCLFFLALIAIAAYSFYWSAQKPFTLDEVIMIRTSTKITTMGPGAYLLGIVDGAELLPHPPLYDYINAFIIRYLGSSEYILRSHGILFYICTLIVLLMLIKHVFSYDKEKVKIGLFIAASIYIINPLIIQYSILIDGDSAITMFLITLFVYLFIRYEQLEGSKFVCSRYILALVLCTCLMIKELTPFLIAGSIVIFRLIQKNSRKLIADLLITIMGGFLLFWLIWSVYCHFTGTNILAFLEHTIFAKSGAMTPAFIARQLNPMVFLRSIRFIFYWPTAALSFLILASFFGFFLRFVKSRTLTKEGIVFILSAVIFVAYHFGKASVEMVKYQYTIYPLFIFAVAWFFVNIVNFNYKLEDRNVFKMLLFGFICVFLLSVYYYKLGDYILLMFSLPKVFYVQYFAPILVSAIAWFVLFKRRAGYSCLPLSLLFCIYPISIGLNLNQTAPYTTSSSWMNYGERGFKQTVDFLKENIRPGTTLIARGDICYYLKYFHGKDLHVLSIGHVYADTYKERDYAKLVEIFSDDNVGYLVFDNIWFRARYSDNFLAAINHFFVIEKEIGNFVILSRKGVEKGSSLNI